MRANFTTARPRHSRGPANLRETRSQRTRRQGYTPGHSVRNCDVPCDIYSHKSSTDSSSTLLRPSGSPAKWYSATAPSLDRFRPRGARTTSEAEHEDSRRQTRSGMATNQNEATQRKQLIQTTAHKLKRTHQRQTSKSSGTSGDTRHEKSIISIKNRQTSYPYARKSTV